MKRKANRTTKVIRTMVSKESCAMVWWRIEIRAIFRSSLLFRFSVHGAIHGSYILPPAPVRTGEVLCEAEEKEEVEVGNKGSTGTSNADQSTSLRLGRRSSSVQFAPSCGFYLCTNCMYIRRCVHHPCVCCVCVCVSASTSGHECASALRRAIHSFSFIR